MNMPAHIIAKPTDVETNAAPGESCSSAFDTAGSDQRGILGTDTDR
jgi:hypothetical protein